MAHRHRISSTNRFHAAPRLALAATVGAAIAGLLLLAAPAPTSASTTYLASGSAPPPLHISGFSPTSGVAGTSVSISGTSLSPASAVSFGGVDAQVVSVTATKIVAKVPATSPVGTITITTPADTTTSSTPFKPVPKLTAIAPKPAQATNTLTLTGTNLLGATTLKLGSLPVPIATIDSATQITTNPLPDNALTGPLSLVTPGGTSAGLTLGIRPTITSLSTTSGAAGTAITLTGKTFTATKTVAFGGTNATFKILSPTQLTTTVPTAALTGPITVTNNGGTTPSTTTFTVLPRMTSFAPASGVAGTSVSISGSGLGGASAVSFGGVDAQVVSVTATKIVAKVPATSPVGTITITTPADTTTSSTPFKPVPKLTAIAPKPAQATNTLTLTGTNLLGATTLKLGSLPVPIATIDSATQITTGPLPDNALTGPLSLVTPGGTSAGLTLGIRPTISSLSTTSGTAGTVVTLTGKTFTATKTVAFGGTNATFKILSPTQLTTTVPTAALTGPITVTNSGGTTPSTTTFTVLPKVTSFAPATAYPGTTVTINGKGLGGATAVKFNGTAAGFAVVSSLKITAVVAAGTSSGPVAVTTAAGTATSARSLTAKPFVLHVNLPGTDVDSIDPSFATSPDAWHLENATCAKLLNYPDSGLPGGSALQPEVADSMPAVSDDGLTYTFTIRPGFKFSPPSTQEITAQTFKLTIERALAPAADDGFGGPAQAWMQDVEGAFEYMTGLAPSISGIVAVDVTTLQITLNAPAPDLLTRLALPYFCAVPTDAPAALSSDPLPSAGPYYVSSYTEGSQIVLARNPGYGGTRTGNPDQIVYATGGNPTSGLNQVLAGQADYQGSLDNTLWAKAVARAPKQTLASPLQVVEYLALNTSRPLFSSVAARQAANLVINRTQLVNSRGPSADTPTDQYLPPGIPGYRDAGIYPLNGPSSSQVAKANALVKQAGVRGQTAILYTCDVATCVARAQSIKAALARIGLRTEIHTFHGFQLYEHAGTQGEPFDLVDAGWVADYSDPFDFLNVLFDGNNIHADNNNNLAYFNDPAYNTKLEAAALLTGSDRSTTYGDLDIDLATNAAPWVAYGTRNVREVFSARIACRTYQPIYGIDLATLCVKP